MIYIILFLEFFKVGLFTVGGGLASLPFLYELADKYTWFDEAMIADMIAISQSTPGPIGINMATYAGFKGGGFLGGIIATIGIVTPSFIIIIIIAHYLQKFRNSKIVEGVFTGLRPCVFGLILLAWLEILKVSVFNIQTVLLFIGLFLLNMKYKKHPIFYIALGAVLGILFKL